MIFKKHPSPPSPLAGEGRGEGYRKGRLFSFLYKGVWLSNLFIVSGCGSLISGTKQEITFLSDKEGAVVIVNDEEICKTPCVHDIKRSRKPQRIAIKKEGYVTEKYQLESTLNWVSLLNIPLPGMVAWFLIDVFAGGAWKYEEDSFFIPLKPENESMDEANETTKR